MHEQHEPWSSSDAQTLYVMLQKIQFYNNAHWEA